MAILQENIEVRKNAAGGKGEVSLEHLRGKEQIEAYGVTPFILQGKGVYNDNGTEIEVGTGTIAFCPDGEFHGLSNENGTQDLVFMALIINS